MSAYTSRILPVEEWPKLAHAGLGDALTVFKPADTQALVVEHEGQIVGVWLGVRFVHAEGVWIAPAHRGAFGVVKRLLTGMREIAARWGVDIVWTGAVSDDALVRGLIEKLGGKEVPMQTFILPMRARCPR